MSTLLSGGGKRSAVAAVSALVLVMTVAGGFVAPASATAEHSPLQVSNNSTVTTSANSTNSSSTSTPASNWSAPGPFGIDDLRTGGESIATDSAAEGPPESMRYLETGAIALKFLPVNPAQTSYQELESGQRLQTNSLLARTSAFGESTGDYEMVFVYWQERSTSVNGTQRTYAANQTVQRIGFTVGEGYGASRLDLRSHYGTEWQVTAWLERGGERVDGARWRFSHQTNPLTASPAYPTDSKGDLWWWAGLTLILPAIGGILVSGITARHVLERTIVGSLKGITYWAVVVAVVIGLAVVVATWQTSVILANAPIVVGLLMGLLALPVMLSIRDSDLSKAGFFRRDLDRDAVSPQGEDTVGTRRVPNRIKKVYQKGDNLYAPVSGLRPMLARYWANPAYIPTEDWKSYDTGDGDLDRLFEVDPGSDKVLTHKPAHLTFSPSLTVDVDEEDLVDPPEKDGIAAVPAAISAVVSNWLSRVNWRTVGIAVGGATVIYAGTMLVLDAPLIAAALAPIPAIVDGYEARDGSLEVDWGPSHWNDVMAQVQTEREEYEERSTFDQVLSAVAEMEWKNHEKGQQIVDRIKTEIHKAVDEEHGGNHSALSSETESSPQTGVGDD